MLPGALNSISIFLGCLVFVERIEEVIQDGSRLFNTADERELNELMQKKFASTYLKLICGECLSLEVVCLSIELATPF